MNIVIIGGGDHAIEVLNYIVDDSVFYRKISNIYIIDKSKKTLVFLKISRKIIFTSNIKKIRKIKILKHAFLLENQICEEKVFRVKKIK